MNAARTPRRVNFRTVVALGALALAAAGVAAQSCRQCGVVESVEVVEQRGQGSAGAAVGGAVVGGVVGSRFGGGSGRTVATTAGAIGGGVAANRMAQNRNSTTSHIIQVRMEDGTLRRAEVAGPAALGARVRFEDNGQVRFIN
jgi:outer membrane lipoprotein SlyB